MWGLEVNISKTKAMRICRPGKKLDPLGTLTLFLKGDTLEWVTSFNYVGVEVTDRGNLQTATAPMKAKAHRAQFKLSKLVRSLSFDTKLWLHQTMVDPILLHGAEVWIAQNRASLVRKHRIYRTYGDQGMKPIPGEKTKMLFVRTQMGAPRFAPIIGIRGDSVEFPLYLEGLACALKYKNKIDNKENESLLGLARRTQEDMAEHQEDCWLSTLTVVEQEITQANSGKAVANKAEAIDVLKSDYKKQWRKTLKAIAESGKTNPRVKWYRKFKKSMKRESYLNGARSGIQLTMVKLRLGGHHFPVETGRWAGIPLPQRKCKRCNAHRTGSILYCFQCPGNEHYLQPWRVNITSEKKLIKIIQNPTTTASLGIRDLINSYR